MLAIYYVEDSSPFHMYVLEISSDEHMDFLAQVDKAGYPYPTSDILFMEGEKIIDQWTLGGLQNEKVF